MSDKKILDEDGIAANAAGSGNVAGLGVGAQGEPGRGGPVIRRGKFAGHDTFLVPESIFHKARLSKRDKMHWETYISKDEYGKAIREYANKYPKKAIVLQHETTGAMMFARYGKGHKK